MAVMPRTTLSEYIRSRHDFPRQGMVFRDITPLLLDPAGFHEAIRQMAEGLRGAAIDAVAAAEPRGFIFAAPLALELNVGFLPLRRPTRVQFSTQAFDYALTDFHDDILLAYKDNINPSQRILYVDDLLATGTSVENCCRLIEHAGGVVVGCTFLIELKSLRGAERLAKYKPHSLIQYP
jgi:adenine phosphoribosyltransferase